MTLSYISGGSRGVGPPFLGRSMYLQGDIVRTPPLFVAVPPARPHDHLGLTMNKVFGGRVLPFLVSFNLALYYST